jgi:hypothetical protein
VDGVLLPVQQKKTPSIEWDLSGQSNFATPFLIQLLYKFEKGDYDEYSQETN